MTLSKRSDLNLLCLLIHGARAVVKQRYGREKANVRSQWLVRGYFSGVPRMWRRWRWRNRMAHTAWAVLASDKPYEESSWQNPYIESFNRIFRTTFLNRWSFLTLAEAGALTQQ